MLYIEQHLKDQLTSELNRNERLIWAGVPKRGFQFNSEDKVIIPFSVIWCAFVTFWIYAALESSFIFALFGIPFALVGLYLLFGRFFFDRIVRSNTVYGLSNERVLMKVGFNGSITNSFLLKEFDTIDLIEHDDGTGTIEFMTMKAFISRKATKNITSILPSSSRLYKIKDAQKVYSEILELRNKLKDQS
ncbi:MAG: hypothetical protein AB8B56_07040 [Crocinitomicaceae bacterium]